MVRPLRTPESRREERPPVAWEAPPPPGRPRHERRPRKHRPRSGHRPRSCGPHRARGGPRDDRLLLASSPRTSWSASQLRPKGPRRRSARATSSKKEPSPRHRSLHRACAVENPASSRTRRTSASRAAGRTCTATPRRPGSAAAGSNHSFTATSRTSGSDRANSRPRPPGRTRVSRSLGRPRGAAIRRSPGSSPEPGQGGGAPRSGRRPADFPVALPAPLPREDAPCGPCSRTTTAIWVSSGFFPERLQPTRFTRQGDAGGRG